MKNIEKLYGKIDQDEIDFYMKQFDGPSRMKSLQKELIFLFMYKYFGDSESIKDNDKVGYIKLMIYAKRILLQQNMLFLPYIISSKIEKFTGRKSVNKKELARFMSSPNYPAVVSKYNSDKQIKIALGYLAQILSSQFRIVDYENSNINGQLIDVVPDMVIEEILLFILLI